ncbi:MAG: response regulator transcription factor [Polynucleobacter sp.]|nr:response regulator transcription factor [Polynucleobacter sp.]
MKFDVAAIRTDDPLLLMDPHPINASGMQKLLEEIGGFNVVATANDEKECIKLVKQHKPSLAVIEPLDKNHFNVNLIQILASEFNIKVLVLTQSSNHEDYDLAIIHGAKGVLYKSEPHEVLIRAVSKVLGGELWIQRDATSRILMRIAESKTTRSQNPQQKKIAALTKKELQIVNFLHAHSEERLNKIAGLLHISEHTLRNHLASIYSKLGIRNRLELYVFAEKNAELLRA